MTGNEPSDQGRDISRGTVFWCIFVDWLQQIVFFQGQITELTSEFSPICSWFLPGDIGSIKTAIDICGFVLQVEE